MSLLLISSWCRLCVHIIKPCPSLRLWVSNIMSALPTITYFICNIKAVYSLYLFCGSSYSKPVWASSIILCQIWKSPFFICHNQTMVKVSCCIELALTIKICITHFIMQLSQPRFVNKLLQGLNKLIYSGVLLKQISRIHGNNSLCRQGL